MFVAQTFFNIVLEQWLSNIVMPSQLIFFINLLYTKIIPKSLIKISGNTGQKGPVLLLFGFYRPGQVACFCHKGIWQPVWLLAVVAVIRVCAARLRPSVRQTCQ